MAIKSFQSFVMPLFLVTNLLFLSCISNDPILAEARNLLDTTLPEFPYLPELPIELPKFEFPPLPFFLNPDLPGLPELPAVANPETEASKLPSTPGKEQHDDHMISSSGQGGPNANNP